MLRVFRIKLLAFLEDLRSGHVFGGGHAVYIMTVVEFQKRGLPHAHIALRIAGAQPLTPAEIDSFVSAELPDVSCCRNDATRCTCRAHRLRRFVEREMIHAHYPQCFQDGHAWCSKRYPHPVTPITYIDARGFVHYRRRTEADRWVVPYSPSLSLKYDCHINVEISRTVLFVKYMVRSRRSAPQVQCAQPPLDLLRVNFAETLRPSHATAFLSSCAAQIHA